MSSAGARETESKCSTVNVTGALAVSRGARRRQANRFMPMTEWSHKRLRRQIHRKRPPAPKSVETWNSDMSESPGRGGIWLSLWMQPAPARPRWSGKPWRSSRETFSQNASSETRVMIATPLIKPSQNWASKMISPHRSNRRPENLTQDGRPLRRYRRRWIVERTIAWLGNHRRLLTRHEKHASLFAAFATLGCLMIALRHLPLA